MMQRGKIRTPLEVVGLLGVVRCAELLEAFMKVTRILRSMTADLGTESHCEKA